MVEFFDYNCGYCKRAFPDVMKMIEDDKDLKLVMKEFPILGPGSVYAARAALASRKQGKYWEFHLALMAHEGQIDEAVADQIAEAVGLDVEQAEGRHGIGRDQPGHRPQHAARRFAQDPGHPGLHHR